MLEVHKGDGELHIFVESDRGLFYLDITEERNKNGYHSKPLVQTVMNNPGRYNKCDYLKAVQARKLKNKIG